MRAESGFTTKVIKVTWTVAVILAVGVYFFQNYDGMLSTLAAVPAPSLLAAVLLMLIGKLVLVEMSRRCVAGFNCDVTYWQMGYATFTSQLGKYIPGGVWHFVGRAAIYRDWEMSRADTARALLLEQGWLVASGFCFGAMLTLSTVLSSYAAEASPLARAALGIGAFALVVPWFVIMRALSQRVNNSECDHRQLVFECVILLSLVFGLMGTSFWVIAPVDDSSPLEAVGAFSIAWAIGYIAVFAPSGIGVREGALILLVGHSLTTEQAVFAVSIHRMLWSGVELFLALGVLCLRGSRRLGNVP